MKSAAPPPQPIVSALQFPAIAILSMLAVAPLVPLSAMIATAFEFRPTANVAILVGGTVATLLAALWLSIKVYRADPILRRPYLLWMSAAAFAGVSATILIQYRDSVETIIPPYFLHLEMLLQLDRVDVTAAEDAAQFDMWFELWICLFALVSIAAWLKSALTRRR